MMSRGTQEHVDCTESSKLSTEVNMDSNSTADEHQVNSDEFSSHLGDGINKDDDFSSVHGNIDGCNDKPKINTKQNKHYTKEPIEIVLGAWQVFPFSLENYFKILSTDQNKSTTHTMSHELLRLSSLSTFPRTIDISMIRLARAGFYYTDQSSETTCFSCRITYKGWTSGDDPMTVHRRLSPSCDIVRHNRQNISSTIDNQEMERAPPQTSNQYQHSNGYATQEVLKKQKERVSCYGQIVLCFISITSIRSPPSGIGDIILFRSFCLLESKDFKISPPNLFIMSVPE